MSAEAVTSAVVKQAVLHPAMDAAAISDLQRDLLLNERTPAADSLIELLEEGAQVVIKGSAVVAELMRIVVQLTGLEDVETEYLRQVTGWSDSVSRHLRNAELNADKGRSMSGRKLAGELRPLLTDLSDPVSQSHASSRGMLRGIFERYPREVIFRDAVTYDIGARAGERLLAEYERWERARYRKQVAR